MKICSVNLDRETTSLTLHLKSCYFMKTGSNGICAYLRKLKLLFQFDAYFINLSYFHFIFYDKSFFKLQ